jgi:hypothetical protein
MRVPTGDEELRSDDEDYAETAYKRGDKLVDPEFFPVSYVF